ncbi:MAG: ATP phosphoribosyltransferase [Gammaproteobacteria bacterium TMED182]|nr:ATP phosphoribosyltransferase [Gammaproteobacteria bacterium]RPG49640.1 MAG: ATP phosphoribosyltransferase [Gammaproteobacteria bacterium TMED182]
MYANTPLVIALSKGRPLKQLLERLDQLDISPIEDMLVSRKLVFDTHHSNIKLMVLRGLDVATYVDHGIADIGMVGKDVLLEYEGDGFYEPLDLKIAECEMMEAGMVNEPALPRRLRVATKFTQTAKKYYAQKGIQIDMIKLTGAMELAPVMGLAHRIIDIVETGSTLKANGLETKAHVCSISSRLIVNKVAFKTKQIAIQSVIDALGLETG